MRKVGSHELKTHLSEILDAVAHGQTIVVTRHGKAIARITPDDPLAAEKTSDAVKALLNFLRTPLPKSVTV